MLLLRSLDQFVFWVCLDAPKVAIFLLYLFKMLLDWWGVLSSFGQFVCLFFNIINCIVYALFSWVGENFKEFYFRPDGV